MQAYVDLCHVLFLRNKLNETQSTLCKLQKKIIFVSISVNTLVFRDSAGNGCFVLIKDKNYINMDACYNAFNS